jgi:hypothetical protein
MRRDDRGRGGGGGRGGFGRGGGRDGGGRGRGGRGGDFFPRRDKVRASRNERAIDPSRRAP